jgi:hypothetical protein
MKKQKPVETPTTLEALAKNYNATTEATEKFQALVYSMRKSLGLNSSVKDKIVNTQWTGQLLGLLKLIEGVESATASPEVRVAYQVRLLGTKDDHRSGELFHFRENYKAFLRDSARDMPRDLEKFFDGLELAIRSAV